MKKFLRYYLVVLMALFCGTVIAQEVTLDFTTNDSWNLPVGSANKATASASFSNGSYSITLAAADGYYFNSDGYLMLGKAGSTLTFPAFSFDVEKIVITGRDAASGSTKQNIYVGDVAVSTETTGAKTANTYEIASDYQAAGNIYVLKVTSAHNTQITKIEIYKKGGGSTVTVTAPTISGTTPFTGSTEVSITGTPEGGKTYYTTDGSDPTSSSTLYSAPFTINESTTVKAISYDKDGNASSVTAKTFTKETYTEAANIAAFNALEAGTKNVKLTLTNAQVLGAGNNNYAIKDASGSTLIYQSGLSYTKGQILNGTIVCERADYNGFTEIKSITDNTLTATDGTLTPKTATPEEVIAAGYFADSYKMEKVECKADNGRYYITVGENKIQVYDNFKYNYSITADGTYNLTGVLGAFSGVPYQFWLTEAPEAAGEVTIGAASDIDDFKSQDQGKLINLNLANAQVVYAWTSSNGNIQAFIRDDTGAICMDFRNNNEPGKSFTTDKIVNGSIIMNNTVYNGLPQASATAETNTEKLTFSDGSAADPVKISSADVSRKINDLVLLENVTITEKDGKYYVDDVQLYNQFKLEAFNDFSSFVGEGKNVKGIAVIYQPKTGDPIYEIYTIDITSQGGGGETTGTTIYSWSADSEGTITENGGKAVATDGQSVGFSNKGYTTIRVSTKKANVDTENIEITLDNALEKGDVITVTGYKNKNEDGKLVSLFIKFEKGEPYFNDEETWVNICDENGTDFDNDGNTPNTNTYTVAEDAAGSKTIKLSRSKANTNLFITSFVITRGGSTGIENTVVKPVINNGIRYNLAGQRVDENYKGVVIMNGKKYVVK